MTSNIIKHYKNTSLPQSLPPFCPPKKSTAAGTPSTFLNHILGQLHQHFHLEGTSFSIEKRQGCQGMKRVKHRSRCVTQKGFCRHQVTTAKGQTFGLDFLLVVRLTSGIFGNPKKVANYQ